MRQRGLALLLLLWLVALGAAVLLWQQIPSWSPLQQRQQTGDAALALAKQALIAYAVTYGDFHSDRLPGYLPCPDLGPRGINVHEGSPDPPCGGKDVSALGRLPWHELGLEALRDGAGECLWYAVSGSFKNSPAADMLNWDSLGQLAIMAPDGASFAVGAQPEERAAAVIFAPGPALAGQDRSTAATAPWCGGNYVASNYLDAYRQRSNAALAAAPGAPSLLTSAGPGNGVNDGLLAITPREIFAAVRQRHNFQAQILEHLRRLSLCVAAYGGRNKAGPGDLRLPWAASLSPQNPNSDAAYGDEVGRTIGHLPYSVAASKAATANLMQRATLIDAGSCPPPWSKLDELWYQNWKDHLFYAVAGAYAPNAAAPGLCNPCLSVNGAGRYAAILIFAGPAIGTQRRSLERDKAAIGNYLEDANAAGGSDYRSAAATEDFNDLLYCVDTVLRVAPCA